jgi:cell division protein FtsB
MSFPRPNRSQLAVGVVAVIVIAVVGGLVWAFGQQLMRARQMRAEEMRLERSVAAEQARHDELVAQLEYVQSDEYVEQWAREDAKMARPGEVVVVVRKDSAAGLVVDAPSTPVPEPESQLFWTEFWELIFGPADQ